MAFLSIRMYHSMGEMGWFGNYPFRGGLATSDKTGGLVLIVPPAKPFVKNGIPAIQNVKNGPENGP